MASTFFDFLPSFVAGNRLIDGGELLSLANMLLATTTGITALSGGNAAGGTQLQPGWNRVDTCAADADSVRLPPAIANSICAIYNNTAHTVQVFGQQANQGSIAAGDKIIAAGNNTQIAVATGLAQTTAQFAIYVCFTQGLWKQFLSA